MYMRVTCCCSDKIRAVRTPRRAVCLLLNDLQLAEDKSKNKSNTKKVVAMKNVKSRTFRSMFG